MSSIDFIYQIANICADLGITEAIICPGSRSAPITISFARNKSIKTRLIFDERSAAYIALGMAQKSKKPVVLICTSGTAALNFSPAVAEAYWQQIPLLVLTGDRPIEWIGQGDGQTINQNNIFINNCKASYSLPTDKLHKDSIWMVERTICEAIYKTTEHTLGPVHINIPVREPFYPDSSMEEIPKAHSKIIKGYTPKLTLEKNQWADMVNLLLSGNKIALVAGHHLPDYELKVVLNSFLEQNNLPLLADINSNLMGLKNAITYYDLAISNLKPDDIDRFAPDILVSFGNEFVSKNLKNFIRKNKPKFHIHLSENEKWVDTFQSVTHFIKIDPVHFFAEIVNKSKINKTKFFLNNWLEINDLIHKKIKEYEVKNFYSEISIVQKILKAIPSNSIIHLSNSLPVRYANLLGIEEIDVYCNRGTSGIDGCVSTAVGLALKTDQLVTLLSGDVAFLYDRNAFWHNHLPSNLRLIVLNNGGGQIFRTIDGSKDQPELDQFFVGDQNKKMDFIAKEYNLVYYKVESLKAFEQVFNEFYKDDSKSKILEICFDGKEALHSLKEFKSFIYN